MREFKAFCLKLKFKRCDLHLFFYLNFGLNRPISVVSADTNQPELVRIGLISVNWPELTRISMYPEMKKKKKKKI